MRMLTVAAGAALLILAAGPASAGERDSRGGGHPGGGCGSRCGGGGGHPGGGNINVNVNANASASARAYAGASASSVLNARAYNVGSIRGGAVGGGTVYVGGGYGGDMGGYYGGAIYNELPWAGRVCASAPFGYVLGGFGRVPRAPDCGGGYHDDRDRGGRYGYSERHEGYAESRYESRESYSEYEAYEGGWSGEEGYVRRDDHDDRRGRRDDGFEAREYDRGYMDGRRDCDCGPDGRDGTPWTPPPEPGYAAPYEPPVHAPPPVYEAPMTPNQYYGIGDQSPPPRQYYSQEPGERG